jgi:hypothetical protein
MGKIIIEGSSVAEVIALAMSMQGGGNTVTKPVSTVEHAPEDDDGPVNTSAPERDSAGMRWDDRIHSASKGTTANGEWRKVRGLEKKFTPQEIASIEAELRAPATSSAPPPVQPVQPVQPPAPMPMTPAPMQMQPVQTPAPMPAPVQPQPQAPTGSMDFNTFMQSIARLMQPNAQGQVFVDTGYLIALNQMYGLNNITDLAAKPDMIATVVQQLRNDGRWQDA